MYDILRSQSNALEQLIFRLENGANHPSCTKSERDFICKRMDTHTLRDGDLIRMGDTMQVCITTIQQAEKVLSIFHEQSGHIKFRGTREKISQTYYWPGMTHDIKSYIASCEKCQFNERIKTVAPVLTPIIVKAGWDLIGMDLIGPLPKTKSGNTFVLTLTDYFTKWVEFFPLLNKSKEEVSEKIESFVLRYGQPKRFITDQGREFVNQVNMRMFSHFNIKHSMTAAYHPQTNGLDERTNQTLKERLRCLVNKEQDDWDKYLLHISHGINSQRQASTKKTPYELLFGRKMHTKNDIESATIEGLDLSELAETDFEEKMELQSSFLDELHAEAFENIQKAQERQSKDYAKRKAKGARSFLFNIGDDVLKKNMKNINRKGGKMENLWLGPYVITRMKAKRIFLRKKGTDVELKIGFPYDQLKPFHAKSLIAEEDKEESLISEEDEENYRDKVFWEESRIAEEDEENYRDKVFWEDRVIAPGAYDSGNERHSFCEE